MKFVRARLRHNVHCAGRVISILGGYRAGFDFELLHGVRKRQRQCLVAVRIVMNSSVQQKCETVVGSAGDGDNVCRIVSRSVLPPATNGRAGGDDQFGHLPRIQRQFHHANIIHDLTDTCVPRFDERGIRLDLDSLRHLSDFQHDIKHRISVDLKDDSGLHEGTETGKAGF